MNISVFEKTMENIRKTQGHQSRDKQGCIPQEGDEDGKDRSLMNKPIHLGQAMLDLSKIVMYEFHYDYMFPKYGDNIQLCYMDTDSFTYDIKINNFYRTLLMMLRLGLT